MTIAFELAVQDAHGLAVAARLKVDRVELCSALPLGGVTPSRAFIEAAVATAGMPPVHVLIRPRLGGFEYAPDEVDLIVRDAEHALAAGAAGVVVGGVRDGRLDADLLRRVADLGAPVTVHRVFDTLAEPSSALDLLAELGVRRVLTAGGPGTVESHLPGLAALVAAAAGRVEIMAGGGVRASLIEPLLGTGVSAVHASAKHVVAPAPGVVLGSAAADFETTDEAAAAQMLAAVRRA